MIGSGAATFLSKHILVYFISIERRTRIHTKSITMVDEREREKIYFIISVTHIWNVFVFVQCTRDHEGKKGMYFFPKLVSVGHFFLQNENYFVLFGEKEIDPTFVLIGSNIQHTCEMWISSSHVWSIYFMLSILNNLCDYESLCN